MLNLSNPVETSAAVDAVTADAVRIIRFESIVSTNSIGVTLELGTETDGTFVGSKSKRAVVNVSGSLMASITTALENALKARVAKTLGVGEGELSSS